MEGRQFCQNYTHTVLLTACLGGGKRFFGLVQMVSRCACDGARSGRMEIWRMPAAGGVAVQITTSGGCRPFESADGQKIYYVNLDGSRIHSVPVEFDPE